MFAKRSGSRRRSAFIKVGQCRPGTTQYTDQLFVQNFYYSATKTLLNVVFIPEYRGEKLVSAKSANRCA